MNPNDLVAYTSTQALDDRMRLFTHLAGPSRLDKVLHHLEGFDGMDLCDVGCGNGEFLRDILSRFPRSRAFGIDTAPAMVEEARKRCDGYRVDIRIADMSSFALGEKFDRMLVCHSLHLAADKHASLKRILSCLKPGGRCVLTVHSRDDFPRRREWIDWYRAQYGKTYRASHDSFVIEAWDDLFQNNAASNVSEIVFSPLKLTRPEPCLASIETERSRFDPFPSDQQWQAYREHIRADIQGEIERRGVFEDQHAFGVVVISN